MADQLFNLKLVAQIEKHPCLYNYTLPQYSRKDITEKAWDDVGRAVNLTRSECKERWKNLRAVFVRHLKPGSGPKSSRPYYLADAMKFALPFVKTAHNAHSAAGKEPRAQDTDSDHEDPLAPSAGCGSERPSPCSSPASRAATLPSPQPSNYWTKTKRSLADDPDAALTEDSGARAEDKEARDEANKMFLLSLLPDVNQMSPSQVRRFKRKAMESIDDILENVSVKTEQD